MVTFDVAHDFAEALAERLGDGLVQVALFGSGLKGRENLPPPPSRMMSRRFTRLTTGFSKKRDNLKAAVSLFAASYTTFAGLTGP